MRSLGRSSPFLYSPGSRKAGCSVGTACLEVQVHPFENCKETLGTGLSLPHSTLAALASTGSLVPSARLLQVCGAGCPPGSWHRSPELLTLSFCSWREPQGGLQHGPFTLSCCTYSCFVSCSSQGKSKGQLVTAEANGGSGQTWQDAAT